MATNNVRPSRAGDQFHYLWAARRCLQLLSFQNDINAISIEGSSPGESPGNPAANAGEEVIDLAEYFGSQDIQTARLVRYMQLKHSTLQATEPWTASGLENTITGFSKRYQELLQLLSADALATRVEFWFVTNRPVSAHFVEAVADAAAGALSRHPGELQKLERFTGLQGSALTAFSKQLHFRDRQDDYWDQRNILFQDVNGYLPDIDVDAPTRLKELVTRRALPEGEQNPTITKMDVLRALNTTESLLFPAPCLVKSLSNAVSRAQEPDIIRGIAGATTPVIVHASAGVGKTIFATRIANGLPAESTCILYDSYGNGLYRKASGYRHRHKDALVQIANELASHGLCHLLIPTTHADPSAYVRAFVHRIGQAATLIRLANPNALLCIIVDAADNAQMAAEEVGEERSFVRDLIREEMPDNVRLVFLCRTHRQTYLDPPADAIRLELRSFSREETADHLKKQFPGSSEHDVDEFHRLSSQNPRVQALALSRNKSLPETLRLLGPNPTTVESTIESLLEDAIAKLRDSVGPVEKGQIDKICEGLAVLRPLIPVSILSQISGVDEGAIKSFAIDLGRPLLLAGDTIQFFDEPAETWFREKFKPSAGAMTQFIDSLKSLATTSAYVSSVLPQLMLETGHFSELVEVALTSAALPNTNELEKRDVELQRLQFALKAGLRSKRYLDAAKLALKAGGVTAGDSRQRKLLQEHTDLAATFLEPHLIEELVSRRTFGSGWLGSHHAYEAALLSGRAELVGDARSRLRMANEWLRNWSKLTPEERKDEEISEQDITELALADLNIHGPKAAADGLARWKPRGVSFRVGRGIARRLIDHGRFKDAEAFANAAGSNIPLVLAITIALREIQRLPPVEVTRRAFWLVASARITVKDGHSSDDQDSALNAVTALVEAALQQLLCSRAEAAAVLSRYLPSAPPRELSSRFTKSKFPILRAYCLRAALQGQALEVRDLAHAELRAEMDEKNQHSQSRELQEFLEVIGSLLPWHRLWAKSLLRDVTRASLDDELKRTRDASNSAGRASYRDGLQIANEIALLWFEILRRLDATDAGALTGFLQWKAARKGPLFTPTLTTIARMCGQREETKDSALRFALEAYNLTKDERSDAENKSQGFIDVARAILAVSKQESRAYFNAAVEVASKIGDENLSRWDAILTLANRAARADRPSPEMAYHFARCAELTYEYVVRDKYFDWWATVEALCDLCPSSSLAILSRWRDRGFGWSERLLPIAIGRLVERGSLDARDALAVVSYRGEWSYDEVLDRVLLACANLSEKEAAIAFTMRYMRFGGEHFSKVKEVATRHGMSVADVDEIIAFEKDNEDKGKAPQYPQDNPLAGSHSKPHRNWDEVFAGCDLANVNGLSQAYTLFKNTEAPWDHSQFVAEAFRRVPIGSESEHIVAVGKTPLFDIYFLRDFLEQVPDTWKGRPAIAQAFKLALKEFCRRFCMKIGRNRHYEVLPFKEASALAETREDEIVEVVLDAIGVTPDLADSNRLFSLIGLLATKLSEDEALDSVRFGLDLFSPVLEGKDGDGPWSTHLLPPTDVTASLAGYIWASMAAPEGVMRWEGAHAILGLATLRRKGVLGHVFECAAEKRGGVFVDAKLPFYGLHALQWFLIGIARAASEVPEVIEPFATQIVAWALMDQPHVLLRQFAARAALALLHSGKLVDQGDLKGRLATVNSTSLPVVESKSYQRVRSKKAGPSSTSDDDRFYFGLDIGPYWYEPLGRVFALAQDEIESEALKVIRDEFGSKAKGKWDEDERSRRKLYEEEHTYHSHGSHPRADTLQFYHAYHGMMIVAGKLLASTPTHRDSDYGEDDGFAEWLHRHGLTRKDGRWLWDRRDPTPVERFSWMDRKKDELWRDVPIGDFDEALRPGGMINLWGYWTAVDSDREQSISIHSALVSPDKSSALLRALGTAKNVRDYAIPSAESRMEIDEPGFSLKGWIADGDSHDRDLDGQDRWSGGISFPPPMPAPFIIDLMGIGTDLDCRRWRDKSGLIVMASQMWGHYDEGKRNEDGNPERGSRIQASLEFVTSMLAKLGRDLIIEVQVDRRQRYRSYESRSKDDKERIPTQTRLYLLGSDGRFRTL